MRISPIRTTNSNIKPQNPAFTSWNRTVYSEQGNFRSKILHSNYTLFFRDGYEYWNSLVNYLIERYNSVPKVNVYNYGCSNGSEAFTFLMSLINICENLLKKPQLIEKFTKIKARDYDAVAIEKAKQAEYEIGLSELEQVIKCTCNLGRFFSCADKPLNVRSIMDDILSDKKFCNTIMNNFTTGSVNNIMNDIKMLKNTNRALNNNSSLIIPNNYYQTLTDILKYENASNRTSDDFSNSYDYKCKVKPILTEKVDFQLGDIITDYKEIEPKNSIIFARNFWAYLNSLDRMDTIENLYNHIDKSSMVIIGDFDKASNIETDFYRAGFEQYPEHSKVFIKR